MGWRDCVSPEQEFEIDSLSDPWRREDPRFEVWANLVRQKKTDLSLRAWLDAEEASHR